jgi:hypothetical protein
LIESKRLRFAFAIGVSPLTGLVMVILVSNGKNFEPATYMHQKMHNQYALKGAQRKGMYRGTGRQFTSPGNIAPGTG